MSKLSIVQVSLSRLITRIESGKTADRELASSSYKYTMILVF